MPDDTLPASDVVPAASLPMTPHPESSNPIVVVLILIVAIGLALGLTKLVQYEVGATYELVKANAQIDTKKVAYASQFHLNDGTLVSFDCAVPPERPEKVRGPDGKLVPPDQIPRWLTCAVHVGISYLMKFEMWDTSAPENFRSSIRFFNAPKLVDGIPARSPNQITLTPRESNGNTIYLGELLPTIPLCFNIKYYVEEDSLKALLVSAIQESAHLEGGAVRIDEFSVNRITKEIVRRIDEMTGFFKVRKDWGVLLIGGTFQTIVIFVFFFSLTLTVFVFAQLATCLLAIARPTVDAMGVLAGSLGGSLTYFGLLGTLLGIFLAVGDLSAIDFVDEMKKVFDQTKSFGSMSLALGSSVLGLGGALALWIIQAIGNFICGRAVFEL